MGCYGDGGLYWVVVEPDPKPVSLGGGDVGNGCDGGNGGEDGGGNAMNTIAPAGDQTHPVRTTNKYFNPSQLWQLENSQTS